MSEEASTRRALLRAAAGATLAGAAGCTGVTTPADIASSGSFGNFGYVITAVEFADRRGEYVPVDARNRAAFRSERIYGARHLPVEAISSRQGTPDGRFPDGAAIARALADAGIRPDDDVVVYGSSVGSRVTRVVFALEYAGHRGEIRVLNGGYESWYGRTGTGPARARPATYGADVHADVVVTRSWIRERLGVFNDGGPGLVDVRPTDAYLGQAGSPGLDRRGHIPGAMNIHWVGNVDGRRFKEPGELAELYFTSAGLPEDRAIVVYGDGNVNATHTYVTLRALGFEDVRMYAGGFTEWANVPAGDRGTYPVETKTQAVIETSGSVGGDSSGDFSCTG